MSSQNSSLENILEIVTDIARIAASGDFIYRGEPRHHPKVSSNLYRDYEDIDPTGIDIEDIQRAILNEVELFIGQGSRGRILAELQHYGGKTNLIDFTTDYLVALFFACDGYADEDGRVIFLSKSEDRDYDIWRPETPSNRVNAQKSVFVEPRNGFVAPDKVVNVPGAIKSSLSKYLLYSHGIATETIYNDLFGFIRYRNIHQSASIEFRRGLACQAAADLEGAIDHFTKALDINPRTFEAYFRRGICHLANGNTDSAIQDFNSNLELDPENPDAHASLGEAHIQLEKLELAAQNFTKAIELEPENADYHNHRGLAHVGSDDHSLAVQDFSRAIELDPDNPDFHNNLGQAYKQLGELALSTEQLRMAEELDTIQNHTKAIEQDPTNANAQNSPGIAYLKAGSLDLAIEDFSRAIELEPGEKMYYCNRGEAWVHLSEWDKARSDFAIARAMDMDMDIVASFRNDYESVADFESKRLVKLPDDIATILGG